jgi:hypothetical protein
MTRVALAALLVASGWWGSARAENETAVAAAAPPHRARFALGASAGFLRQKDLGGTMTNQFVPSLVGLAYVNVAPRLYLRPGARLGISGLIQPPAASDAHLEEHSVQGRAELGLLYDAWVIPAIAVGTGIESRDIEFSAAGKVQDSGLADRTEWLGSVYAQAGLGVPLLRGFVVIEPYYRLLHTFSDDRSASEFGFDLTFAL